MCADDSSNMSFDGDDPASNVEGFDPTANKLRAWIKKVTVGRFEVPVRMMQSPPLSWGSRTRSEAHINALMKSFTGTGTVNTNIMLVDLGGEARKSHFKLDAASQRGLCAITGDHTRVALTRLSEQFPRNPIFSSMKVPILTPPDTQETFDMLRLWGTLDNFRMSVHQRESFKVVISKMHEHLQADRDRGVTLDQARIKQLKEGWIFSMKTTKNTIGAFYQIAKRTGRLWNLIECILNGQVANPKTFKIPLSTFPFTEMSDIPEYHLVKWLQEVVNCKIDTKQFKNKCLAWKVDERIRRAIITHLTTKHDLEAITPRPEFIPDPSLRKKVNADAKKQHLAPNWFDGVKQFPHVCNVRLLVKWQSVVSKLGKKEKMPPQICEDVDNLMQSESKDTVVCEMFRCFG